MGSLDPVEESADLLQQGLNSRRYFFNVVATSLLTASSSLVPRASLMASNIGISAMALLSSPSLAAAESSATIEMKEFFDPYGMFVILVPDGFYTIRRKSKGDLPNDKGEGRRGSSIFTSGNMAKAEVIAVERFPTRLLLEENGIEATGNLATFPDIGEPSVVAGLINMRRERDRPSAAISKTILDPTSVSVSPDGKELKFKLRTEIQVQKPELLMEQYGVNRLFRVTSVKASLQSNDGNLLAVFASALEVDFNTQDGEALQRSVDSFRALEREFGF